MADKFDHGRPRIYFSSRFLKNHLCIGLPAAKKRAEIIFQRRNKAISTVICLSRAELGKLAGEVFQKQKEFERRPDKVFITERSYELWSRGGKGSSDKQRATPTNSAFQYKVEKNSDGTYIIDHFAGM